MCVFLLLKNYIIKAIYVKHLIRERFSPNVDITYNTLYTQTGGKNPHPRQILFLVWTIGYVGPLKF